MNAKIFGYNQEAMVKFGVSIPEALILSYLKQFFQSGHAESLKKEGKTFFKIYYTKILNDNLALQFGEERLRKVLRSLERRGLIEKTKENPASSTLFLRVCDRPLVYTNKVQVIKGQDVNLKYYIKTAWQVNKNCSAKIYISHDEHGNEIYEYENSFLTTNIIMPYIELFIRKLESNLQRVLSEEVFHMIDTRNVVVIHNKIKLCTINNGTLPDVLMPNAHKIESAICLAYLDIFKNI